MKKIFLLIFLYAAFSCASAQELTVLHVNDTHSHMDPERSGVNAGRGGVVEQAAYFDEVRSEEGRRNVLLLHAGDFSQGTSYFTELGGDLEIDVLNAQGFDAVALGNHEFDNGMEELARRLKNLKMPVVCANYDFSDTPLAKLIKPYAIVRKAGLKIGVIGLLTDLSVVVDSDIASRLKYLDPSETVMKYAGYLKNDRGCDLVICLSHLGYEGEFYTDVDLAGTVRNVDLIVGGHSHTLLDDLRIHADADGKDVVIVQDGKWGLNVGRLDIKWN